MALQVWPPVCLLGAILAYRVGSNVLVWPCLTAGYLFNPEYLFLVPLFVTRAGSLYCLGLFVPFCILFPADAHLGVHLILYLGVWLTRAGFIRSLFLIVAIGLVMNPHRALMDVFTLAALSALLLVKSLLPKRKVSVSVVVPVASQDLPLALKLAQDLSCLQSPPDRVVLALDTNSSESIATPDFGNTQTLIVRGPRGRGYQIRQGVLHCRSDVILILHADCQIKSEIIEAIQNEMRCSGVSGGILGHKYEGSGLFLLITEFINNLRFYWLGISFGDQGQFFLRRIFYSCEGLFQMPILEDVDLGLRLWDFGLVVHCKVGVTASARRWRGDLWDRMSQAYLVLSLLMEYLVRRRLKTRVSTENIYYRYYNPVGKSKKT